MSSLHQAGIAKMERTIISQIKKKQENKKNKDGY